MITYQLSNPDTFHHEMEKLRNTMEQNISVHEKLFKQLDKRPVLHPGMQRDFFTRLLRSEEQADTHCLSVFKEWTADSLLQHPFYQAISYPEVSSKVLRTEQDDFVAYELVVANHAFYNESFHLQFPLGMFTENVTFPQLILRDQTVLTVTPNEINTMQKGINDASGNVLLFGVGSGYMAHQLSQKENVTHLTIVEKDDVLIRYFTDQLLPQFSHHDKITVIHKDALQLFTNRPYLKTFDYLYVDIWEDVLDGFPLYLFFKERQKDLSMGFWLEDLFVNEIKKCLVYHVLEEERFIIPEQDMIMKKVRKFVNQTSVIIRNWEDMKAFLQNPDHLDRISRIKV